MKPFFHLTVALFPLFIFGQSENQITIAKFIISDAKVNNVDISPTVIKNDAYIVFYTNGNERIINMANVWPNSNSQSYGPMYGFEAEKLEETYENYAADFFYFNWQYNNTYDSKSGTAKVEVIKIYKPQGIAFSVNIVPENLDIIVYKGYMEGSIDFSLFNGNTSSQNERFRKDYSHVSIYDVNEEKWSEWAEGDNTFVINFNKNGDIAHYKPNGEMILYKKISNVEEGNTSGGDHYQIITALDEDGQRFQFQFFDNPKIGLKLIYDNILIQFSKF